MTEQADLVSTHKILKLNFGGYSTAGLKDENQDAFTAHIPDQHVARKFKGGIACIADGVSNSRNSKLASQTAVTNFATDYFSTPEYWTVQQSAQRVVSAINAWLFQQGRQSHIREDGFVTTFSSVIIKSHTAHILHAGDSRVYLLRNGELKQLTDDHNYYQGNANILSRALGIEPKLDLDYLTIKVHEGDRFILTTDGVHEHLESADFLTEHGDDSLEAISQQLVDKALANGSDDNASCLLLNVEQLPVERLSEAFTDVKKLAIPPELKVGNKLDHFEILQVIQTSTRSHIYLAKDHTTQKRVVIKIPSLRFQDDIDYLESFAREQWIGRKLNHPQIVTLYSPPQDTQFLYHVLKYIEGKTLRQWIIDNPEPSIMQVREVLTQMIQPVRALKRNKMIHRDLKPENFMIDDNGVVTLIDLGTVKVAGLEEIDFVDRHELPEGDLHYIAPEVLVDGIATWQSDLFSLASIVYEMLSKKMPYNCVKSNRQYPKNYNAWKYRPLRPRSQRDDLPIWIDTVLSKALSAKPSMRHGAFSEFERELTKPSRTTLATLQQQPLFERDPLTAWKGLSAILFVIVLLQLYVLLQY